jgi:iron complex transport system substrate-binding protein
VFRERSRGKNAVDRRVTAEEVVAARPDVMLASWCGKRFDAEAVRRREGFAELPAVSNNRIYEIPAEIILQPGPASLTDGLEALQRLLVSE